MIKKIFVSVAVLVLIVPVFAVDDDMSWMMDMGADDPLASADSGGLPGEGAAGFSDDDLLFGAEPGGAAGAAEDDLFFGMDAGTTGAATAPSGFGDDDLLFGAAPETGADDFGMDFGMDMGMDAGADDPFGFGAAPAPELPDPATPRPAAKPAAPKPAGPMYLSAVPETNIVYSKSNSIGQIRTLRDLVPFGIIATSNLDDEHAASNLVDGRLDTAWVERRMTGGEGEALTLDFSEYYFARVYERKARAVKVESIRLLSGYHKDREQWNEFFRPKKVRIKLNNRTIAYADLSDNMNWQTVKFTRPVTVRPGDKMRIEFLEVFPEIRRENDARIAITQIALMGKAE